MSVGQYVQRAGPGLRTEGYLSNEERAELRSYAMNLARAREQKSKQNTKVMLTLAQTLATKNQKSATEKTPPI